MSIIAYIMKSSVVQQTMIAQGKGNVNIIVVKAMKILRLWKARQRANDNSDKNSDKNLFKHNLMSELFIQR